MGRKPRIHFPGAIYHVTSRGVGKQTIFIDGDDRRSFLELLKASEKRTGSRVIAYCLMGNHYHFIIRIASQPLGSIMQRLLTPHAKRLNSRLGRVGHFFEGRYKAGLILDDRHLLNSIRYIHYNPVRAAFVSHPNQWPWSNAMEFSHDGPPPADFDPWPNDRERIEDLRRSIELPPQPLEALAVSTGSVAQITVDSMKSSSRRRDIVKCRREFAVKATNSGYTLTSVARWLGVSVTTISRYCVDR